MGLCPWDVTFTSASQFFSPLDEVERLERICVRYYRPSTLVRLCYNHVGCAVTKLSPLGADLCQEGQNSVGLFKMVTFPLTLLEA